MATLTNEQIEQKKQLLAEKLKEMKAISDELNCGREMLSDDELDDVAGGGKLGDWLSKIFGEVRETFSEFSPMFGNPNP